MDVKAALQAPLEPTVPGNTPVIRVRHPGYPQRYNPLLQLPALHGGIDYDLIYYACCLLVGNAWTRPPDLRPYFALDPTLDTAPLPRPDNNILPVNTYYFHVPKASGDPEGPYPITPSFNHWSFPHDNLPPLWNSVHTSPIPESKIFLLDHYGRETTIARDESCRITLHFAGVENAHLVPVNSQVWFNDNEMYRYAWRPDLLPLIHDLNNVFLLRADLHTIFDNGDLVIVPKSVDGQAVLVTHVMHAPSRALNEMHHLYHNRRCQRLYGIAVEYLFARFAWAIFQNRTVPIFDTPKPDGFKILIREDAANSSSAHSTIMTVSSPAQIPPSTSTPRSASRTSSRKRRCPGATTAATSVGNNRVNSDGPDDNDNNDRRVWHFSVSEGRMVPWEDENGDIDLLASTEPDDHDYGDHQQWHFSVNKGRMVRWRSAEMDRDSRCTSSSDNESPPRGRSLTRPLTGFNRSNTPPLTRSFETLPSTARSRSTSIKEISHPATRDTATKSVT